MKDFKSVENVLPKLLGSGRMLDILEIVEKDVLPELLDQRDIDIWQSLYVDYEKPFVERLWRQLGPIRINLHKIHSCIAAEALFHPHPWPSAVHVLSGEYETGIGVSVGQEKPGVVFREFVSREFKYEMPSENAWHYVRPVGGSSCSVMVTGEPWKRAGSIREIEAKKVMPSMRSLTTDEKIENLLFFWNYFLGDALRAAKQ